MIIGELQYLSKNDNEVLFALEICHYPAASTPMLKLISKGVDCSPEELSAAMGAMRDIADLIKELNRLEM